MGKAVLLCQAMTYLHPIECSSGGIHLALPGGVLAKSVEEGAGVEEAGQVQRAYRGGRGRQG